MNKILYFMIVTFTALFLLIVLLVLTRDIKSVDGIESNELEDLGFMTCISNDDITYIACYNDTLIYFGVDGEKIYFGNKTAMNEVLK